jgi:hypothetical protein
MAKMKLVQDKDDKNTFRWVEGKREVAEVTLEDGLIEFTTSSGDMVHIARIGKNWKVILHQPSTMSLG